MKLKNIGKQNSNICQSCGIPLQVDPHQGGTNSDGTKSNKYCGFCFQDGRFLDEGITLQEKMDKIVRITTAKMNLTEAQARELAMNIIPKLERWK